jgi:hypothetical protein
VAFRWTETNFPIVTKRRELNLKKHPVISVIAVRRNRRTYDSTCSAWEIHPVMKLTVQPSA